MVASGENVLLRGALVAFLLFAGIVGYVLAFSQTSSPRLQAQALLHSLDYSPKRLILYLDHPTDLDALYPLQAANRSDLLAVTDLFPASCRIRADLVSVQLVTHVNETTRDRVFGILQAPDRNFDPWLKEADENERIDGGNRSLRFLLMDLRRLQKEMDLQGCRAEVSQVPDRLARYEEILLFADAAWVRDDHFPQPVARYLWQLAGDVLDLKIKSFPSEPMLIPVQAIWHPIYRDRNLWRMGTGKNSASDTPLPEALDRNLP